MSDKEWEVSYNEYNDTYTVKEAKKYDYEYTPSTDPSARERLNKRLRNKGRGGKIFLTVLFNLYGSLYRFSSNTVIGFLCGLIDIVIGKILPLLALVQIVDYDSVNWFAVLLAPIILWIVDLVSIIKKNDIVFLGNKKYKNYNEYMKK
ncbi:MAG: hypothetical protein E7592_05055 [Ruminococcaceae bacterium]|nr:hypothetical protein [Oscillospiraceae bacterium]